MNKVKVECTQLCYDSFHSKDDSNYVATVTSWENGGGFDLTLETNGYQHMSLTRDDVSAIMAVLTYHSCDGAK